MVGHRIFLRKVQLPCWAKAKLALTHDFIRIIQWLQVFEPKRNQTRPDFFHRVCLAVGHTRVQTHHIFHSHVMSAPHVICKFCLQFVLKIAVGHRALDFRWRLADAVARFWVKLHAEDQGWGSFQRDRAELLAELEHCDGGGQREGAL